MYTCTQLSIISVLEGISLSLGKNVICRNLDKLKTSKIFPIINTVALFCVTTSFNRQFAHLPQILGYTWIALINCPNDNLIPYSNCPAVQTPCYAISSGRELASNWIRSTSSLTSFRLPCLVNYLALSPALSSPAVRGITRNPIPLPDHTVMSWRRLCIVIYLISSHM